jgi:hypothetical protein
MDLSSFNPLFIKVIGYLFDIIFGLCIIFLGMIGAVFLGIVLDIVPHPVGEPLMAFLWAVLQYWIIVLYAGDSKIAQFWTLLVVGAVHVGVIRLTWYVRDVRAAARASWIRTMQAPPLPERSREDVMQEIREAFQQGDVHHYGGV